MKKAKLMLLAVGVVGIVGGVLAFNAKTGSTPVYTNCAFGDVPSNNATTLLVTSPAGANNVIGTYDDALTCVTISYGATE